MVSLSKSRLFLFLGILAIFLLGFGASQFVNIFFSSQKSSNKTPVEISHETTQTAVLGDTRSEDSFVVTRVIDGDTIELNNGKKVRYIGIDTPETVHPEKPVQCFGREASEENKRLVGGKSVRLVKDVSETDRYGRLLRYVYVGDVFVNDYLVRQGFAYSSTYPPDVAMQQQFLAAQKEAQENGRGLWGGCSMKDTNPTNESNITNQTNQITPITIPGESNSSCVIKGNISTSGEKIYHMPGCGSYSKTAIDESAGERWFCSEDEALKAGWRKAKNC